MSPSPAGSNIRQISVAIVVGNALAILASATLVLFASAKAGPTVTSSVVMVDNCKHTVCDYADPAAKKFRGVVPEGLKTVRRLEKEESPQVES